MKHCNTHMAVIFYLFKTPPASSKKALLNFVFIQNARSPPPLPLLEKSLRALCEEHCNTHKIVILCLFKTPPPTLKKMTLNFVFTYSKRPPRIPKMRLLPPKTEGSHSTPFIGGGPTQPPPPDNPDLYGGAGCPTQPPVFCS